MAASTRTLASASTVASFFGSESFTAAEYDAYRAAVSDLVALSTLARYGFVCKAEPMREVIRVFSPIEFADYVSDEMVGEDCYGMTCGFEWDAAQGVFEEVYYTARYVACV